MHLSATSIVGNEVQGMGRESLGLVEDVMIDTANGRIEYVVVSFGGLFGIGEKLFAVPLEALTLDTDAKCFILPVPEDKLKNAPGFDKNDWPDFANLEWCSHVRTFYDVAS